MKRGSAARSPRLRRSSEMQRVSASSVTMAGLQTCLLKSSRVTTLPACPARQTSTSIARGVNRMSLPLPIRRFWSGRTCHCSNWKPDSSAMNPLSVWSFFNIAGSGQWLGQRCNRRYAGLAVAGSAQPFGRSLPEFLHIGNASRWFQMMMYSVATAVSNSSAMSCDGMRLVLPGGLNTRTASPASRGAETCVLQAATRDAVRMTAMLGEPGHSVLRES